MGGALPPYFMEGLPDSPYILELTPARQGPPEAILCKGIHYGNGNRKTVNGGR